MRKGDIVKARPGQAKSFTKTYDVEPGAYYIVTYVADFDNVIGLKNMPGNGHDAYRFKKVSPKELTKLERIVYNISKEDI